MAYSFRPDADGPVYVDIGQKLQFQYRAPSLYGLTETVNIYIGDETFTWGISVPPADFGADPFGFSPIPKAKLDTAYYYADGTRPDETVVTVSGLSEDIEVPISITANLVTNSNNYGIKINDATDYIIPDGTQKVKNGDTFTIFAKSQNSNAAETKVFVNVGSTSSTWSIFTKQVAENKPSVPPDFEDKNSENLNTYVYSNPVQILGLTESAEVTLFTAEIGVTPEFAITTTNITTQNVDGYDVVNGAVFGTTGNILNGEYLQLRVLSSSQPNDPYVISISIGDGSGIASWTVTTNAGADKEPNEFLFGDVTGATPSTLVEGVMIDNDGNETSIGGLGEPVPVTLISATSGSNPKIKINPTGSIGNFSNVFVNNGDKIYLYNTSSADENGIVETQIKVGTRTIGTWVVQTEGPPITIPVFSQPNNLTGQKLNTYVSSALIELTAITVPIQITSSNSLISIDSDTPVSGPRTFDPAVNNFVSLSILTSNSLDTPVSTNVKFGDAPEFTWSARTALFIPDQTNIVGTWYSIKNKKYDGYAIGTVLQVLKESATDYGDIETRFPGFIECDGRELNTFEYRFLHAVISNTYGGTAYNAGTTDQAGVSTTFKVPDYRNKRICGTGVVDGNVGASKFLPITSGGSNSQVGETGGWWYVDEVDVSGDNPYEQVYPSNPGANTGTTSPFFTLGTVRTFGTENIEGDANFTIANSSKVSATINGLTEVFVNVPLHEHLFLTSGVESEDGEALIPWGSRAYYGTTETFTSNQFSGPDVDESPEVPEWIAGKFEAFLAASQTPDFSSEVSLTGLSSNEINYPPGEGLAIQPFGNYWYTDFNALNISLHDTIPNVFEEGRSQHAGVIDTQSTTCTIQSYVAPGALKSHSHVLGLVEYDDINKDFTYGNSSGVGTFSTPAPGSVGLGGYGDTIVVEFNQPEVLVGLNEATFTFSNTKKPSPTFYMDPQRRIPMINSFHKIKYIIKAY